METDIEEEEVNNLISTILEDPLNLATEIELREQIRYAKKAFYDVDNDGSGYLTRDEVGKLCEEMGLRIEEDEDEMLRKIDADGSDEIELNEWLSWWLKRVSRLPNPAKQHEVIAINTFKKFDIDNSGSLDITELGNVLNTLGADMSEEELEIAMNELDNDRSGRIDQQEFVDWWCNRAKKNRHATSLVALKLKKLAQKANQIYSTDIFTAVWNSDLFLVKSFVESDPRSVVATDVTEYGNGWTPLHYASYQGNSKIVEYLLNRLSTTSSLSSAINKGNDHGFNPLFYACQQGHFDVCELLLSQGADPSIYGIDPDIVENKDTFMCPASFAIDHPELKTMLLQHNKCTPPDEIPISKISASFTSLSNLSINLPMQKLYTVLPIESYTLELSCHESLLVPPLSFTVKATAPSSSSQSYSQNIDKKWLQRVYLSILSVGGDDKVLTLRMTIKPINVMRIEGPVSSSYSINIKSIIEDYQKIRNQPTPVAVGTEAGTEVGSGAEPSVASIKSLDSKAGSKRSSIKLEPDSKGSHQSDFSFKLDH